MIGLYFSGTGNTKFCVNHLLHQLDPTARSYSIEDKQAALRVAEQQDIILGTPIYYSNLPKIMRDFLLQNPSVWHGKRVYIVATMGLFSGDGAGLAARILKKCGAAITGGLHIKMPDCIGDVRTLLKSLEKNREIVKQAQAKMDVAAARYRAGKPTQQGLHILSHAAGLLGQRLYFRSKTKSYTDKLKVNQQRCIGCGRCAAICPMQNLSMQAGKAVPGRLCTMCYRCISNCPQKAITLLGSEVLEQCKIERYL